MTTKQLIKYAGEKLKNYDDVFFFVNAERRIKPFAQSGEKYGIAYNSTNKLIAHTNSIDTAKQMIDDFVCREEEMEKEALKYSC